MGERQWERERERMSDEIHSSGAPSQIRAPEDTGFASLRFGPEHGVLEMATELQAAMDEDGVDMRIIDMAAGGDIDREVFSAIEYASTFIVFGSMKYGEDTGNQACTYYEHKHAKSEKKKIILIRMIPWDQKHEELQGRVIFGANKLALYWEVGTPMPSDLSVKIMESMGQPEDKIARAKANAKRRAAAAAGAAAQAAAEADRIEAGKLAEQAAAEKLAATQELAEQEAAQKLALQRQAAAMEAQMEQMRQEAEAREMEHKQQLVAALAATTAERERMALNGLVEEERERDALLTDASVEVSSGAFYPAADIRQEQAKKEHCSEEEGECEALLPDSSVAMVSASVEYAPVHDGGGTTTELELDSDSISDSDSDGSTTTSVQLRPDRVRAKPQAIAAEVENISTIDQVMCFLLCVGVVELMSIFSSDESLHMDAGSVGSDICCSGKESVIYTSMAGVAAVLAASACCYADINGAAVTMAASPYLVIFGWFWLVCQLQGETQQHGFCKAILLLSILGCCGGSHFAKMSQEAGNKAAAMIGFVAVALNMLLLTASIVLVVESARADDGTSTFLSDCDEEELVSTPKTTSEADRLVSVYARDLYPAPVLLIVAAWWWAVVYDNCLFVTIGVAFLALVWCAIQWMIGYSILVVCASIVLLIGVADGIAYAANGPYKYLQYHVRQSTSPRVQNCVLRIFRNKDFSSMWASYGLLLVLALLRLCHPEITYPDGEVRAGTFYYHEEVIHHYHSVVRDGIFYGHEMETGSDGAETLVPGGDGFGGHGEWFVIGLALCYAALTRVMVAYDSFDRVVLAWTGHLVLVVSVWLWAVDAFTWTVIGLVCAYCLCGWLSEQRR
eukprot:COSAG02_NODE_428_length_22489_cov_4.690219_1_plen_849_part_00